MGCARDAGQYPSRARLFFFVLGALGVQELNEGEGWCFHISRIEGAVVTIS